MRRDFRLYLDDILDAIHQIRTYMADQDEEAFTTDRKTQDAVIRNLEIIGEAAGKLPEQLQKTAPEIDWRKVKEIFEIIEDSCKVGLTILLVEQNANLALAASPMPTSWKAAASSWKAPPPNCVPTRP